MSTDPSQQPGEQPQSGPTPPPYGQPPQAYGYGAPAPMNDADQRLWATLSHVSGLIASFVGPLVIWLVLKERGAYVADQAKEALNFQILLVILGVAISIIAAVTLGLGAVLYLVYIVALVFMIQAAIAANQGAPYRYPVNLRLVK